VKIRIGYEKNQYPYQFGRVVMMIWLFSVYGINGAEGAEWKLFQASPAGNIYYFDSASIKHFPNGLVWVWVKIIETRGFSEEELRGLKDPKKAKDIITKAQAKSMEEWRQLFEINCSVWMAAPYQPLYMTRMEVSEDYELPSEWIYIPKDSVTNNLTKMICP
jgi:hypothetical protein